jgi:hypothetical protein
VKQIIATKAIIMPQLYAPNIVADIQPVKACTSHCIAVFKRRKETSPVDLFVSDTISDGGASRKLTQPIRRSGHGPCIAKEAPILSGISGNER